MVVGGGLNFRKSLLHHAELTSVNVQSETTKTLRDLVSDSMSSVFNSLSDFSTQSHKILSSDKKQSDREWLKLKIESERPT